jgi:flap endonuclease-1
MGITGLAKLIADNCPKAIKEGQIKHYFGRKIAIDASMSLYQFLIAVRPDDMNQYTLMNEAGEQTSHLQGMFYRTIRMIDNGIKPIFVFDGKAPTLKTGELAKRTKKRAEATAELTEAKEEGDKEAVAKLNKRTVRVTSKHNDEAKRLLRLMGVPVVESPTEAEAQCVELVKHNLAYAVGSEDMDTLTLGAPKLLRHLTYSEQRKMPIFEIDLDKVLQGLELSMDSFIDLCILLGCDYCDTIRGIGPKRALQLIKQYGDIETILKHLDTKKYTVPDNFPYKEVRELFKSPDVQTGVELSSQIKWTDPDEAGLIEFLCKEKGFSEDRVKSGVTKLKKAKGAVQGRITSFFKTPEPEAPPPKGKGAKGANAKGGVKGGAKVKQEAEKKEEEDEFTPTKPEDFKRVFLGEDEHMEEDEEDPDAITNNNNNESTGSAEVKKEIVVKEEEKPKELHPFFKNNTKKRPAPESEEGEGDTRETKKKKTT